MKYKGIIFDLDGVICSTDQYHYRAWKKLADRLGIPFDEKTNNRLRGVSRMESLNIILSLGTKTFTQEEKNAMAEEKNAVYRALLKSMTEADLTDEVRRTLDALKKSGLKLAVGSSSKNAGLILHKLGLDGFFDAVADGGSITKSKPDPEVFLTAAALLNLPPRACLVVEDAKAGVMAAKAGGFDCAAMGDARLDQNARYSLSGFGELLKGIIS